MLVKVGEASWHLTDEKPKTLDAVEQQLKLVEDIRMMHSGRAFKDESLQEYQRWLIDKKGELEDAQHSGEAQLAEAKRVSAGNRAYAGMPQPASKWR